MVRNSPNVFNVDLFRRMMYYSHVDGDENFRSTANTHTMKGIKTMKAKEIRKALEQKYLSNHADCGRYGRAFELQCARAKSHKQSVSEQNEIDVHVKFISENGKAYYVPCEAKTNGGRIDELLNCSKAKYVIYDLHFVQKHKATKKHDAYDEYRNLEQPVIIPKALFLAKLIEFNAIKAINRNYGIIGF